jgi:hypothetical protein
MTDYSTTFINNTSANSSNSKTNNTTNNNNNNNNTTSNNNINSANNNENNINNDGSEENNLALNLNLVSSQINHQFYQTTSSYDHLNTINNESYANHSLHNSFFKNNQLTQSAYGTNNNNWNRNFNSSNLNNQIDSLSIQTHILLPNHNQNLFNSPNNFNSGI